MPFRDSGRGQVPRKGHAHASRELAVLDGSPAFPHGIEVGTPNIGDRAAFRARVDSILDSRRFTNDGPHVRAFERSVENTLGVAECVAVCNGTMALSLAARAAGIAGEVIIPSATYLATAQALSWIGLTPVFCDIDETNCGIAPERVEELIGPRTGGIVGVHLWGRPCDIAGLTEVARRHRLPFGSPSHVPWRHFHVREGPRVTR